MWWWWCSLVVSFKVWASVRDSHHFYPSFVVPMCCLFPLVCFEVFPRGWSGVAIERKPRQRAKVHGRACLVYCICRAHYYQTEIFLHKKDLRWFFFSKHDHPLFFFYISKLLFHTTSSFNLIQNHGLHATILFAGGVILMTSNWYNYGIDYTSSLAWHPWKHGDDNVEWGAVKMLLNK